MIHYQLRCESRPGEPHSFDGWFRDSAAFETLAKAGLVECTVCGGTQVARALMAPAITKAPGVKGRPEAPPAPSEAVAAAKPSPPSAKPEVPAPSEAVAAGAMPAQLLALLQRMRVEVEKNCEYVGRDFAEEARRLHREAQEAERGGESPARRGIYGEASDAEAEALRDEGIEIARIPWVPPADA
jgi:hypothetical protein